MEKKTEKAEEKRKATESHRKSPQFGMFFAEKNKNSVQCPL